MKRKERHQLKEDEFKTALSRMYSWIWQRKREFSIALSALVVIILVGVGIRLVKAQQLKKESRIFGQIIELRQALENQDETKVAELEKLAGKGQFSRAAYLELASFYAEKGELEKALSWIEKFPPRPKDILWVKAMDLQAQLWCYQKNFDRALEIYELLTKNLPSDFPADIILFHQAQVLEEKGNIDEAIKIYTQLRDEYSQTYYGYEASQKLIQLGET
ncbi:MAG: hypothetical protein B5M54_05250 [Candidatus Aminicenantes bacterium 4484_214]|nr:MAG: hypothetical protein B5M54_05250 [Candidatus Aminicenantes bacterium 4484_214]RLE06896.1 MAG: hypothetical protein DRJ06_06940 [Candidatus Aminicenantes bacterium]